MLSIYLSMFDTEEEKHKFTLLYEQYLNLMLKVAYEHLKDYSLAQDCVHSAFIDVAEHLNNVDDIKDKKTMSYLVTITRANAINMFKKENRDRYHIDFNSDGSEQPSETLEDEFFNNLDKQLLKEKIKILPEEFREPLLLRFGYGMSYKNIAAKLNMTAAAVRKRVQRAKVALRHEFEK